MLLEGKLRACENRSYARSRAVIGFTKVNVSCLRVMILLRIYYIQIYACEFTITQIALNRYLYANTQLYLETTHSSCRRKRISIDFDVAPFTAPGCYHTQPKLMCTAQRLEILVRSNASAAQAICERCETAAAQVNGSNFLFIFIETEFSRIDVWVLRRRLYIKVRYTIYI